MSGSSSFFTGLLGNWPLIRGNLTLTCVGTLTKCPYTAGGRSRRGSPKAGTTVDHFKYIGAIICDEGSRREVLSRAAQTMAALARLQII